MLRGRDGRDPGFCTTMSATDVLVILGCIALGYWVVRSVMSPGLELPEEAAPPEAAPPGSAPQRQPGRPGQPASASRRGRFTVSFRSTPPPAWYLILDVQPDASAAEIGEAVKRRIAHAESAGDMAAITRILAAARQGLGSRRRQADPTQRAERARRAEPAQRPRP